MATQTDIQQLIQGLVPGAVNNGNPNTIYNASPLPPMMDANGNWFAQNLPSATSIPGLSRPAVNATLPGWSLGGWNTPGTIPGVIQPQLPGMPSGGGGTAPPGTGGPGVGTGGPNPPSVLPPSGGGTGGGGGTLPPFPSDTLDNIFGGQPNTHLPATVTGGWGPGGYGGVTGGGGGAGGVGGGTSWQQILDMISEPFLPGNHWLEGTQNLNEIGLGGSILDSLLGLPVSQIANLAGNQFDMPWYNRLQLELAENSMANNMNEVSENSRANTAAGIQAALDEIFGPQAASGYARDSRSGNSAGSSVIAEGEAARDMVGDMQLQQFLNRAASQARAAMNPRYRRER